MKFYIKNKRVTEVVFEGDEIIATFNKGEFETEDILLAKRLIAKGYETDGEIKETKKNVKS